MNSNPKRHKVATTTSGEHEDRLSTLPDSILCHVLSFMPTKYAAMTSILSRRWKCLFLGIPKIDFGESFLDLKPKDFVYFVNRRLMLSNTSSITEFRLRCLKLPEPGVLNFWITTLLFRRVEALKIKESITHNCPPCPLYLLGSETLAVLKLSSCNMVLDIPKFVCFPKLKVLSLARLALHFESENLRFAEESYPLLEDMRVWGIKFPKKNATLGISLRTLKKLAISLSGDEISRIDIDTPHLQHLNCNVDKCEMQVNLNKCECLVSTDLSISEEVTLFPGHWFTELVSKVTNVKELHLFLIFAEDSSLNADSLLVFPNLTFLEVTALEGIEWILLQRAPNLTEVVWNMGDDGQDYLVPENEQFSAGCFAQNLREIRISNFKGDEAPEFKVVRYLLEHVAVLERMIIERAVYYHIEDWESSTLKQLVKITPRSPKCEIVLPGSKFKVCLYAAT